LSGAPPSTHLLHDGVEDQEVPVEMIAREFGKQVADIVMEVTDDKTLSKDERKRKQIEAAPKKSREAKLIKLADKTSNLRAIASSPAADWSVKRRLEYIEWAKNVVAGLRGMSPWLEQQFEGCSSGRAVAQSTVGWCVAESESWTEIGPSPFRRRLWLSPRRNRFEWLLLAYANHLSIFESFMMPLMVPSAVAALNSAVQM
jgi:hypothetical protein